MSKVTAKFKYTGYEANLAQRPTINAETGKADWTKTKDVEQRTLKFAPVFHNGDPAHENTKFWEASPSGEIKLGTINPQAWSMFEIGKEYYVDFTPAP
jgi:hypothetical protein